MHSVNHFLTLLSSLTKSVSDLKKSSVLLAACTDSSLSRRFIILTVSASSLLKASCSLVLDWSFKKGSPTFNCLFASRLTFSQVKLLLTLWLEPLSQTLDASYIPLVNLGHALKMVQSVILTLLSRKSFGYQN